jgi:glycosyltransferase involved in cell wall biosynthesis
MQKDEGASVRIYNLAKSLADSGNQVTVVLPGDKATSESVDGVTIRGFRGIMPRVVLEVLRRLVNVTRPTSLYFYDFLFAFRIRRVVLEADIVQMEHPSSTGLLISFIKKVLKKPVVVDCHDVFQALRLQHTSILRRMLETFLEKLAYENADLLLTVSETEKDYLISTGFKKCKIEVIPNGVDTRFFVKSPDQPETRKKYALVGLRTVVFVGNLEYSPNREAIQALSSVIVPRVLEEIKDVKFVVVGKSRDKLELPGIMFTGFVDNVSEILSISDVAVAPLFHGSGTRLKILEYFSCGLPVVSTSIGAEGLEVKDGVNIFIEDDLYSFALRVIELLRSEKLSSAMGEAARLLVTRNYDWTQITRKLETVLSRLLSEQFYGGLNSQASTTHISVQ